MRVLVGCEITGAVRDAFRRRGHEAWSCDILGPDDVPDAFSFDRQEWPKYHLKRDVRHYLDWPSWDLLIAFPPCTYLCNSGVRWLYGGKGKERDPVRWHKMEEAAEFFRELLDAPIKRKCIENPIIHKYAKALIRRSHDQIINPWMFGVPETKATCLWLDGLPPLMATNPTPGRLPRVHHESPGPDRWLRRSATPKQVAEAMADQWG